MGPNSYFTLWGGVVSSEQNKNTQNKKRGGIVSPSIDSWDCALSGGDKLPEIRQGIRL